MARSALVGLVVAAAAAAAGVLATASEIPVAAGVSQDDPFSSNGLTRWLNVLDADDHRPEGCPPCFNCNLEDFTCQQFAECRPSSGRCSCPPGFGGVDCSEPVCGSLAKGSDRLRRNGTSCDCDDGWSGINCNVCQTDESCGGMMPAGTGDPVCYSDGLVVKENFQMCDITNPKIIQQLKDRKPRASFSCNAETEKCNFQFWVDQLESFYCDLDTCAWDRLAESGRNTTSYTCEHIQCACIPDRMLCGESGSIDLGDFLRESIVGPATFQTVSTTGGSSADGSTFSENEMNKLIQMFFGDPAISLNCVSGECLHRTEVPGYSRPSKGVLKPLAFFTVVVLILGAVGGSVSLYSRFRPIRIESENEDAVHEEPGAQLAFQNISYTLNKKPVLTSITGSVKPGEVLAIMGPSGAGKSTLLDILAQKKKLGATSGSFWVDGKTVEGSGKAIRRISGFVDQDDTMLPTLTVRQTILDSARLRLPPATTESTKRRLVNQIEHKLGIETISSSRIGSEESRGISGGQKRRVAIACELVTAPRILFLDEPTSGLDSSNALNVVRRLKEMAELSKQTVVLTIHQPQSQIFGLFDRLILLTGGGQMVYSGPADHCREHFSRIGYQCPAEYNITDYLIDVVSTSSPSELLELVEKCEASNDRFPNVPSPSSRLPTLLSGSDSRDGDLDWDGSTGPRSPDVASTSSPSDLLEPVERHGAGKDTFLNVSGSGLRLPTLWSGSDSRDGDFDSDGFTSRPKLNYIGQVSVLIRRMWRNTYQNPMLMSAHYAMSLTVAFILGTLFYDLTDDIKGFQNRLGLFFFTLILFGFSAISSLSSFAAERLIFLRERAKGYYSPLAYFTAKVIVDFCILRIGPPALTGLVIYPMVGLLPSISAALYFLAMLVLFNVAAAAICLVIGITVKDAGVANLVSILVMLFSLLFSGFLLNHETISDSVRWMQSLSIFHYAFEGLIVNEVVTLSLVDHKYGLNIEVPGAAILSSFGFNTQAKPRDMYSLAIVTFGLLALAYILMEKTLVERR